MEGYEITGRVGAPELPVRSISIALPLGAKDCRVEIINRETETIDGKYLVSCAQPPVILSKSEVARVVTPDEDIYGSHMLYPTDIIEIRGTGIFDGQQICELVIHPLQYRPKSRILLHHKSISFKVTYEGGTKRPARREETEKWSSTPRTCWLIKLHARVRISPI